MTEPDFDLAIVGAGLAGSALACALADTPLRVALIEARPGAPAGPDPRLYALSPANVAFLRECGIAAALDGAQAVEQMQVRGDAGGQIAFSAYEAGIPALAWCLEAGALAAALDAQARTLPGVSWFAPARVRTLAREGEAARVELTDGRALRARLVVAADGRDSAVRTLAGIGVRRRSYAQHAVVGAFACERAHAATAWQWFGEGWVLACLPMPGNFISIVWSTTPEHAAALLAMNEAELGAALGAVSCETFGALTPVGARRAFELRWMRPDAVVAQRLVLVGDAAHAVHPLSGHGINLGFQDVAALAARLRDCPAGVDFGAATWLAQHAQARAQETWLVQSATDALARLFQPLPAPLAWARNAGMSLAGSVVPLRSALARYAAGVC